MRREGGNLFAQGRLLALGAQFRLASVQDDGFEPVPTVVAAIFVDRHDRGHYKNGDRIPGTGNRIWGIGRHAV